MACSSGGITPNPNFLFHPCRAVNVRAGDESVAANTVNLLAASSRFGLIFIGGMKGVKIYSLEAIQNCNVEESSHAPVDNCPYQLVPTSGAVVLVALNADELSLAVGVVRDSVPVVDMYDVRGFGHQPVETRPFFSVRLSSQPLVCLQDFTWNPVLCDMFTVCLTDGSVTNYELSGDTLKLLGSIPSGGRALAWSPKGKQVVVGKQDGSLVQYKPTMQEAKVLSPPSLFENPVQVMSVCWIAPTVFAAVYLPSGSVDAPATLVVTAFSKTTPVSYTVFEEPCMKTGDHPKDRFWLYHQPEWGILMYASRNSIETAVLGCTSTDKMKWELWELDSHGRAEMPLNKGEETFPLGLAVIYSAQRRIIGKLESWPPMPVLLLLSTCNVLTSFHMKNLAPGVPSLVRPPEPLRTDGQRKPMANAPHVEVALNSVQPNQPPATANAVAATSTSSAPQSIPQASVPLAPQFSFATHSPSTFTFPSLVASSAAPFSLPKPAPVTAVQPSIFSAAAGTGGSTSAFTFGSSGGSSFAFSSTSPSVTMTGIGGTLPSGSSAPATRAPSTFGVQMPTLSALPQPSANATVAPFVFNVGAATGTTISFGNTMTKTTTAPSAFSFSKPTSAITTPTASSGGSFSLGSQGAGVAPATLASASPPSAFTFVPAQKVAFSGSVTTQAMVLPSQASVLPAVADTGSTTAVTGEGPRPSLPVASDSVSTPQSRRPSRPEVMAPKESPSKQKETTLSDSALLSAMVDEVSEFEKELRSFKERASRISETTSIQEKMNTLRENGYSMEQTCDSVKKELDVLNGDVHALNSLVFETFAAVEEGCTQELRNRDPRFVGLLRDRGLDPVTAQQLSEVRRLNQYLEAQLCEVHTKLDLDWQEHLARQKEKRRMMLPSAEAVYRAIVNCRNTAQSLAFQVDALCKKVKELKLQGKLNRRSAHWTKTVENNSSKTDELSVLADSLLRTSLSTKSKADDTAKSGTPSSSSRKLTLSPQKQVALAEYFGQRNAIPVRARVVEKPSESRLLSRLALLMNEASIATDDFKREPVPQKEQITEPEGLPSPVLAKTATEPAPARQQLARPKAVPVTASFSTPSPLFSSTPIRGFPPAMAASLETNASGISPGVPNIEVAAEPIKVPITKVIEVSVQPKDSTSAPTIPAGLSITPVGAAPPEISAAAVTDVAKPLPTRTDAAVSTKAGLPQFVIRTDAKPKPVATTTTSPSSFTFGVVGTTSSTTSVPATPVFSFGKPGGPAPMTFKFGATPLAKPGFMAVKSSAAPTSALSGTQLVDKKVDEQQPKVREVSKYEDVTPPGSPRRTVPPKAGGGDTGVVETQHKGLSSAATFSVISTPPVFSLATPSAPSTKVPATTTAADSPSAFTFPVTPSATTSGFRLNFSQPAPNKSIFGNSPQSSTSTATSAAAFSFTAALAASRDLAVPSVTVEAPSPVVSIAKPMPISMPSSTAQALGSFAFKSPVTSLAFPFGAAVTTLAATSALFQPVSVHGSQVVAPVSCAAAGTVTQVTGAAAQPVPSKPVVDKELDEAPAASSSGREATTSVAALSVASGTPTASAAPPTPAPVVTSSATEVTSAHTTTSTQVTLPITTTVTRAPLTSPAQTVPSPQATSVLSSTLSGQTSKAALPFTSAVITTQAAPFEQPAASFGQTSVPATLPFSQAVAPTVTVFAQAAMTSATSVFGQPSTSATGTQSPFGQTAASTATSPFWKPAAAFGQPVMTTAPPGFGQTTAASSPSVSEKPAASSSASAFGPLTTTSTAPLFGQSAATSNASIFRQPAVTSTASVFGQLATTSTPSTFGQPATTSTVSMFGQAAMTSATSALGQLATTSSASVLSQPATASSASGFGQTSTTSTPSVFGQPAATSAPSVFGQPATTSTPSVFGQPATTSTQSVFGQPATTSTPSVFGQLATTSTASVFGQLATTSTPSVFGQLATTSTPSVFGQQATTSTPSAFGQSATSSTSVFGQPQSASSVFGQSNMFGFGQQASSTAASPFGLITTTTAGTSGSLFGQKTGFGFGSGQVSTPFGQSESLFGQKSFGQPSTPAFGQPQGTRPFGQQTAEQPGQQAGSGSLFGGSGFLSGLGGKPSGEGPPKNIFGGPSTFGSGTQTSGLFGSQGASTFGTSFGGGGAFSGGSFSAGGGSVVQSGFGAFQQQTPTKPAAFGGPPAFGGSPSFGGPPQFGGSPTFGSTPAFSSPFGAPQSPQQPAQQQQGPSAFSAFGSAEGPTFGSLAAQGSPAQQQQQQQQQPSLGFGSPSAFGSSPSFGSPGFGDQSGAPRPSSAFSQWRQ